MSKLTEHPASLVQTPVSEKGTTKKAHPRMHEHANDPHVGAHKQSMGSGKFKYSNRAVAGGHGCRD